MKIFNKVKNNMEYAKWDTLKNMAVKGMDKHQDDTDGTKWLICAALYKKSTEKCLNVE